MVVLKKNKIALGVVAALASSFVMTASAEDPERLLVTTASGFKQTVEDAPASVSVVTREQLETKSYRDVTDALKDVPGAVSYTHLTLPTTRTSCRSRWSPYH